MTHYSIDPTWVRVEIFKESGKWYDTIEVYMKYRELPLIEAVQRAIQTTVKDSHVGMWAVCFDPYHENAHPVMIQL